MLKVERVRIENMEAGCITDAPQPAISFSLWSDRQGTALSHARVKIGDWETETDAQLDIPYTGTLAPFTAYPVQVTVHDNHGEQAEGTACFQTGRLGLPWDAKWITDASHTPEKNKSPLPMTFQKSFAATKAVRRAYVTLSAIGVVDLTLNGQRVTEDYFVPGFTSYKNDLQYVFYDVTHLLAGSNTLTAVVGGGWAVGRFTYGSKSQITAKRQALLLELFIEYDDGTAEKIISDESWQVTTKGNVRFADFYDGETYDATVDLSKAPWRQADVMRLPFAPRITARIGCPVTAHERMEPIHHFTAPDGEEVYDFGQNFAGVICLKIEGTRGQTITVRHAEVLSHGALSVASLRTAKAMITYTCKDGHQSYSPRLTYMGFRYVGLSGIAQEQVKVSAVALYSQISEIGSFACSDPLLNQLQSNILWSGKSNFVEIPTDCPQRDERMGWTGDLSVFSHTACFDFDLSRFLDKWLRDVRSEQNRWGGIPFVVPRQGDIWPVVPTACWGDACIIVPWAEYMARGSKSLLEKQYPCMKRYLKAVKRWAGLFSVGEKRYVWKLLFQFGDWCAPEGTPKEWMKKGAWIGTAFYAHICGLAAQIADILGKPEDAASYRALREKICAAYLHVFTDGNGRLLEEFQTGYVLPIHFDMADENTKRHMAENLARLVKERDYHLSTGFTGTPYLLFALADWGQEDTAFRLLMQDTCPSWLYEVKHGGTTFWEQWDAVSPDNEKHGLAPDESGSGVSFNHYAYGAVGDFLYRRVAGLEPTSGGYKTFRVKPLPGGGVTWAKVSHQSPYGQIVCAWEVVGEAFQIEVQVPCGSEAMVVLPNGSEHRVTSGTHSFHVPY